MLVRWLRSSFAAHRFFCSSPVAKSSISSSVIAEAAMSVNTEVSTQKIWNSSKPSTRFRDSLGRRLLKKSNTESIATVVQKWKEEGGVVSMQGIVPVIEGLRSSYRYADALMVLDSLLEVKDLELNSVNYATHISLIYRVKGLHSAEKFFDGIPEEMKDRVTWTALLHIFVTAGESVKAEALFEKMKNSGFLTTFHPYIHMLSLYLPKKQIDKAEEMITELKKVIPPKGDVYNMWLRACASGKDVEGAERAFAHMKEAKVKGNWETYAILADLYFEKKLFEKAGTALKEMEDVAIWLKSDSCFLIGMHGKMGNKDGVIRIWDNYKSKSKQRNDKVYDSMVRSLVNLGMFDKAEEIFKESESIVANPVFCSVSNLLKKYEKEGKMSLPENIEEGKVGLDFGSEEEKVELGLG